MSTTESFGNYNLIKRVKLDFADVVVSKWNSSVTGLTVIHLDYDGSFLLCPLFSLSWVLTASQHRLSMGTLSSQLNVRYSFILFSLYHWRSCRFRWFWLSPYTRTVRKVSRTIIWMTYRLPLKSRVYGLRKVSTQRCFGPVIESCIRRWDECLDRRWSHRLHPIDSWWSRIPSASSYLCWSYPISYTHRCGVCSMQRFSTFVWLIKPRFLTEVHKSQLHAFHWLMICECRSITSMERDTTLGSCIVRCKVARIAWGISWRTGFYHKRI